MSLSSSGPSPLALHGQRSALDWHVSAALRNGARRDVAAVDGPPIDYFVSAGALFGRFVHACGLITRALDVPGARAGRGHHRRAGYATDYVHGQEQRYSHCAQDARSATGIQWEHMSRREHC